MALVSLSLNGVIPTVALAVPPSDEAHPPIHIHGAATAGPAGYSPAQIRHAYGFDQLSSDGTGQVIALVDAYDDPTVASDLQTFIGAFGLRSMYGLPGTAPCTVASGPHPCFQQVYGQGSKPRADVNWSMEISLDVQWAHPIAPGADLLLVEAKTGEFSDLLKAADVAVAMGAHTVSMSWGGPEFAGESAFDRHFAQSGVTFVAAAGDSGSGVLYPAASPAVLAVGGTTVPLDAAGNRIGPETAWSGSGGGISVYEAEPGYQSSYPILSTHGRRGVPDVAYDADPRTGFAVYNSTTFSGQAGWFQVGGTSAGAPQWAALIALADQERNTPLSSTSLNSTPIYSVAIGAHYGANYRDITSGSNGSCGAICITETGYDFITGLGSPLATTLVSSLAGL